MDQKLCGVFSRPDTPTHEERLSLSRIWLRQHSLLWHVSMMTLWRVLAEEPMLCDCGRGGYSQSCSGSRIWSHDPLSLAPKPPLSQLTTPQITQTNMIMPQHRSSISSLGSADSFMSNSSSSIPFTASECEPVTPVEGLCHVEGRLEAR